MYTDFLQATVWWKLHDPNYNRFCMNHPCDRQTDGQTDGIAIAYARLAYMLSRAKRGLAQIPKVNSSSSGSMTTGIPQANALRHTPTAMYSSREMMTIPWEFFVGIVAMCSSPAHYIFLGVGLTFLVACSFHPASSFLSRDDLTESPCLNRYLDSNSPFSIMKLQLSTKWPAFFDSQSRSGVTTNTPRVTHEVRETFRVLMFFSCRWSNGVLPCSSLYSKALVSYFERGSWLTGSWLIVRNRFGSPKVTSFSLCWHWDGSTFACLYLINGING